MLAVPFLLVVALVVYNLESIGFMMVWNVMPVAAGCGAVLFGLHSCRAMAAGCISFGASVAAFIALFHLAWLFDWGGCATGSSTSALAFLFVPFWATAFAGVIGLLAWGIGKAIWRDTLT